MEKSAMNDNNATTTEKKAKKWNNPFAAPDDDEEPYCGMFGYRPEWLQILANMKVFMFCFVGLGIFHGIHGSYMGSVLPSIERRFGFSSAKIGVVKSMSDVSGILSALFVGHYGGSGHRPRWIAAGTFILGLALLLCATPEFLFPPTSISSAGSALSSDGLKLNEEMCLGSTIGNTTRQIRACSSDDKDTSNLGALIVFGTAEFLMGLGSTMTMILGLPFVDDNVSYKSTPFYFALSFVGRLFGPLLGLGLGAVINSVYYNLSVPPFKSTDPRWISAWYIGFIVTGLGVCFFAVTLAFFPASMPKRKKKHNKLYPEELKASATHNHFGKPKQQPVGLKDLPKNLKRLLTNSIYMIKLASQLVEGLAIAGYMGFSQKFIQNQFPVTPSVASLAGGLPPIFCGAIGILIGSVLIKRFKFQPRHVSMMTVVASLVAAICYFSVLGMGCDTPVVVGLVDVSQHPTALQLESERCDFMNDCNCHSSQFTPICDTVTKTSYASPCFAGCLRSQLMNRTTYYLDCICTPSGNASSLSTPSPQVAGKAVHPSKVVSGLCPSGCSTFVVYIVAMCVAKLMMGIPLSGIVMIQFRVVDYDLKSIANAVSSIVMQALAFLPAPIIAGYIIDSACRFWQTSACDVRGACLLYNANDFRTKLHASVGACKLLGAALDCLITYKMWNLNFDREESAPLENAGNLSLEEPTPPVFRYSQPNSHSSEEDGSETDTVPVPIPEAATGQTMGDNTTTFSGLQKRNSVATRL